MLYSDIYQPDPGNPNVTQLSSAPLSENSFCPQSGAILTGLWHPTCTVKIRKLWMILLFPVIKTKSLDIN